MYARNFYEYYKYSDLEHFIRINPVSKRCAVSIGNILCEYYTVPRLITYKQPCGYTAYTSHTIYDIDHTGELVRVSVRVPKYKDIDGKIHSLRKAFQEGKAQSGLVPPEHMGTAEPRYPET